MKLCSWCVAIALLSFVFFGCKPMNAQFGMGSAFFPKADALEEGLVNKYYFHYKAPDSYDTATDIEYQVVQFYKPDELIFRYYDAGFELKKIRRFKFEEKHLRLIEEKDYFLKDTFPFQLSGSPYLEWKTTGGHLFEKSVTQGKIRQTWKRSQQEARDTTVLGRPAKVISGVLEFRSDTTVTRYQFREVYTRGIGLFESVLQQPGGGSKLELVEQMPLQVFQNLADQADKRIGYIHPDSALFGAGSFQPCGDSRQILDYYNGTPDAGYTGGKRALWAAINPQVDPAALRRESGYLTFRFVVNCKGEAGWFVLEQAGLDYRKKVFDQQTIRHLSGIVAGLKAWHPTVFRGKPQDAYCYLTFKLKDGEIVDLLP